MLRYGVRESGAGYMVAGGGVGEAEGEGWNQVDIFKTLKVCLERGERLRGEEEF